MGCFRLVYLLKPSLVCIEVREHFCSRNISFFNLFQQVFSWCLFSCLSMQTYLFLQISKVTLAHRSFLAIYRDYPFLLCFVAFERMMRRLMNRLDLGQKVFIAFNLFLTDYKYSVFDIVSILYSLGSKTDCLIDYSCLN